MALDRHTCVRRPEESDGRCASELPDGAIAFLAPSTIACLGSEAPRLASGRGSGPTPGGLLFSVLAQNITRRS
jgi:hypothetical protein